MTDAIQQRSRYQCALKKSEECISCLGNSFHLQGSKLRRLKFPVILFVRSTRKDVSMVTVAGRVQKVNSKTRIKIPVSSIPIIPQYCRSAPNNTMVEWEETSKMAAFIFLVDYCPIINTKLSQLGSVSSRFLNVYPCLISR